MANPVCFTSPPSGITCPTNPAPLYPANPAPAYNYYSSGNLFSPAFQYSPTNNVTPSNPLSAMQSAPTPLQGEFLSNCPFIAALQSIAWVNRRFIISNISGPNSGPGIYSVTFWNYQNTSYSNFLSQQVSLSQNGGGSQLNSGWGNAVPVTVVVNGTIALNGTNKMVDPNTNMSYGAGSSNSNEIWPALYEKAYAKFILYQYGLISASQLQSTSADPTFCQVCGLTSVQWGGNAGIALAYLTGLPCYSYSTASSSFSPMGNLTCSAQGNIFSYIKTGFCGQTAPVYGVRKTMYPLVAWTYPSESASPAGLYNATSNPSGIQYSSSSILPNHCYPILGIFEPTISGSTAHYIVLGTTFGGPNPNPNVPVNNFINIVQNANSQNGNNISSSTCYDALFQLGTAPSNGFYPYTASQKPRNINIPLSNGMFGLEGMTTFQKYFQAIAWAQGF